MDNNAGTLDVFDEEQLKYYTNTFNCSREDLLTAVLCIGTKLKCLEMYLQMNNKMFLTDHSRKEN